MRYSIDRIDVNGGYSKENCRWATDSQQATNKRNNRIIEYNGEKKTLSQWCLQFGIEHSKARYRLSMGWELNKVFSSADFR